MILTARAEDSPPQRLALDPSPGIRAGLVFTDQGRALASATSRGLLLFWRLGDVAAGRLEPAAQWRGSGSIRSFKISPSGRFAAVLLEGQPARRKILSIDLGGGSVREICEVAGSDGDAVFMNGETFLLSRRRLSPMATWRTG